MCVSKRGLNFPTKEQLKAMKWNVKGNRVYGWKRWNDLHIPYNPQDPDPRLISGDRDIDVPRRQLTVGSKRLKPKRTGYRNQYYGWHFSKRPPPKRIIKAGNVFQYTGYKELYRQVSCKISDVIIADRTQLACLQFTTHPKGVKFHANPRT